MSQTDAMLFENWLRERNADAFKIIATRYAAMVYQTCRRILNNSSEAEDVTQECFLILAATSKPIGGYLAPWLHRVAYNRSIARLRSEHRRKEREVRFVSEQQVAHDMAWDEIGGYVDEAIAELPEKLRSPVVAYFLDGKTHEAIAKTLGIPRSTVTYRVDKGVEYLRKTLKDKGVVITGAALVGSMKGNVAAAIPSSLFANLGKLALSGAGHVALPASMAAAPLAKTALGLLTTKTLLATAASLAIVLVAGFGVHKVVYNSSMPDTQTKLAPTNMASNMPTGGPIKSAAMPAEAASIAPSRKGLERDIATQAPPEDADTRIDVAQAGPSFLDRTAYTVSNAWLNFRMTFSEGARRTSCANNLKQFGLVFKMFANEGLGQFFPMLNPKAGHLIFANDNPEMKPVYPEYLSDTHILICPDDSLRAPLLQKPGIDLKPGLDLADSCSYFYLGYVVRSIEDLEAFADAYRNRIARGLPFDADLDTPNGKLYRLREGVERFLITDLNNPAASAMMQSEIPVLIEAPRHNPEGGNVLFMDGHVEYMRFAPGGKFPMNNQSMDILKSLSAMKSTTPPA